jgi:hypothetical protein
MAGISGKQYHGDNICIPYLLATSGYILHEIMGFIVLWRSK